MEDNKIITDNLPPLVENESAADIWNEGSAERMSAMESAFSDENIQKSLEKKQSGNPEITTPQQEPIIPDDDPEKQIVSKEAQIPDIKPEIKPETQPENSDDEFEAIKEPINLSPKNSQGWKTLKEKGQAYKRAALELDRENNDLRQKLSESHGNQIPTAVVDEVIRLKNENANLQKVKLAYERMKNPSQVPAIPDIDTKREKIQNEILDILKSHQTPDENLNALRGQDLLKLYEGREDFWEEEAFSHMPKTDARRIESRFAQLKELDYEKVKAIEDAVNNVDKEYETQKLNQERLQEQQTKAVQDWVTDVKKNSPWLVPMELPGNADKIKIEEAQKHNEQIQAIEQRWEQGYFSEDALSKAQMAGAFAILPVVLDELEVKNRKINELEQSLNKIRAAGRTSNNGTASPTTAQKPEYGSSMENVNTSSADARFDAFLSGRKK